MHNMSGFIYDGPLLTREQYLRGDQGIYRVEGTPINGYKKVNCTSFLTDGMFWSTKQCRVEIDVPIGEYVVNADVYCGGSRNSRASALKITSAPPALLTSAFRGPYVYSRTELNTPVGVRRFLHGGCNQKDFFDDTDAITCGMHFVRGNAPEAEL